MWRHALRGWVPGTWSRTPSWAWLRCAAGHLDKTAVWPSRSPRTAWAWCHACRGKPASEVLRSPLRADIGRRISCPVSRPPARCLGGVRDIRGRAGSPGHTGLICGVESSARNNRARAQQRPPGCCPGTQRDAERAGRRPGTALQGARRCLRARHCQRAGPAGLRELQGLAPRGPSLPPCVFRGSADLAREAFFPGSCGAAGCSLSWCLRREAGPGRERSKHLPLRAVPACLRVATTPLPAAGGTGRDAPAPSDAGTPGRGSRVSHILLPCAQPGLGSRPLCGHRAVALPPTCSCALDRGMLVLLPTALVGRSRSPTCREASRRMTIGPRGAAMPTEPGGQPL